MGLSSVTDQTPLEFIENQEVPLHDDHWGPSCSVSLQERSSQGNQSVSESSGPKSPEGGGSPLSDAIWPVCCCRSWGLSRCWGRQSTFERAEKPGAFRWLFSRPLWWIPPVSALAVVALVVFSPAAGAATRNADGDIVEISRYEQTLSFIVWFTMLWVLTMGVLWFIAWRQKTQHRSANWSRWGRPW